jgi:hypothetical protein
MTAKFIVEGFGPSGIEEIEFDTLTAAIEEAYWARMERRFFPQNIMMRDDARPEISEPVIMYPTGALRSKMRSFGKTVDP